MWRRAQVFAPALAITLSLWSNMAAHAFPHTGVDYAGAYDGSYGSTGGYGSYAELGSRDEYGAYGAYSGSYGAYTGAAAHVLKHASLNVGSSSAAARPVSVTERAAATLRLSDPWATPQVRRLMEALEVTPDDDPDGGILTLERLSGMNLRVFGNKPAAVIERAAQRHLLAAGGASTGAGRPEAVPLIGLAARLPALDSAAPYAYGYGGYGGEYGVKRGGYGGYSAADVGASSLDATGGDAAVHATTLVVAPARALDVAAAERLVAAGSEAEPDMDLIALTTSPTARRLLRMMGGGATFGRAASAVAAEQDARRASK